MADLVNELSWSLSRSRRFDECRRAYWLQHYGSWGGWQARGDKRARASYVAKNLTGRHAWAGQAVHDAAKDAVLRYGLGDDPMPEELTARALARMRMEFRVSEAGEWRKKPKKVVGLVEHAFGTAADVDWEEIRELVARCIRSMLGSAALSRCLLAGASAVRSVDARSSFTEHGVQVWAAPDLAFTRDDGVLELVDWKTGQPKDGDREQLVVYGAYAEAVWGVPPSQVEGVVVYLNTDHEAEELPVRFSAAAVQAWRDRLGIELEEMRALHEGHEDRATHEARFERTTDASSCRWCNFREVC